MQRALTLAEKLTEQIKTNAGRNKMLISVQMLYNELLRLPEDEAGSPGAAVQFQSAMTEKMEIDATVENIEIDPPSKEEIKQYREENKEEIKKELKENEAGSEGGGQGNPAWETPEPPTAEEAEQEPDKALEHQEDVDANAADPEIELAAVDKSQTLKTGSEADSATEADKEILADSAQQEEDEKTFQTLQIDESEIAAELDEIKRNADMLNNMTAGARPPIFFEDDNTIPTLSDQPVKEMNTAFSASLNDRLKESRVEVAELLNKEPIKDLRKGVNVNDRYVFINELFRGDEAMFERSLKTINDFSIFPEAEYWIRRELKLKLGWDEKTDIVKRFDHLVKRRFSAI